MKTEINIHIAVRNRIEFIDRKGSFLFATSCYFKKLVIPSKHFVVNFSNSGNVAASHLLLSDDD